MPDVKNVFLAISGATPAVLTEALYGFWVKRKIHIHSIEIITTPSGFDLLEQNHFFDPKQSPFWRLYDDYGLKKKGYPFPKFDQSQVHVPSASKKRDLSDSRENALMESEITKHLRRLTQDPETRVLASLAGGRKTMSAYMILGMTLYARIHDELFHVLFDSPLGKNEKGWWYPHPQKKVEQTWVNLFEVPFPRLRQIIQNSMPDLLYKTMTEAFSQFNRSVEEPILELDLKNAERLCRLNGKVLRAEPRQLMWLALLAHRKYSFYKTGKCPPKVKSCRECLEKPCALRPEGKSLPHYNLTEADMKFLAEVFTLLRMDKPKEADVKRFDGVLDWAPVASRLRKNAQQQFPEYFEYLDSMGGPKGPGAKARRHILGLDRSKIVLKEKIYGLQNVS